jgi:hypothetical protein
MEKNLPYPETKSWQNMYTTEKAHWQDLVRIVFILAPIAILIAIAITTGIVYDRWHGSGLLEPTHSLFQAAWFINRLPSFYLLPAVLLIIVIIWIYLKTIQLMKEFYKPSESTRLFRRLQQRLFGVPPLPFLINIFWKYSSIVIKEPNDLSQYYWAHWLGGPAPLVIYDGNALYLERGNRFSRVVGPGSPPPPFLDRYETVKAVVDLRPQFKTGTIHPWTKDGIQLDLTITMEAQINSSPEALLASRNLVYPFDPIAVKQAVEFTAVKFRPDEKNEESKNEPAIPKSLQNSNPPSNIQRKKELVESDWLDGLWMQTTGYINRHISDHSIDEIALSERLTEVGPSEGNLYTFTLAQEHIDNINMILRNRSSGAHVSNIQITMLFPKEVREHRIKYWESVRQSHSSIRKSKAEGERIRLVEEARARAERDMLDSITEQLKNIDKDNLTEPILMSLTGILDSSLDDPLIRPIIAKNSLNLLDQLRRNLKTKF